MMPRPDFLQPQRGTHRLAWAALACSLAVLAAAALDAADARQPLAAAQAPRRTVAAAAAARPLSPAEAERQRSLRQAAARLARPWPAAFAAIEAAQAPGVAWLALDIDEHGAVRLEGRAPDDASALAAGEAMRQHGGWGDVLVTRIDKNGDGGRRFALTARAQDGRW